MNLNLTIRLLKAVIETHLTEAFSNYETTSNFACHATYYAAEGMIDGYKWGDHHDNKEVAAIRGDIMNRIAPYHCAEDYAVQHYPNLTAYEFRLKMMKEILAKYEEKAALVEHMIEQVKAR